MDKSVVENFAVNARTKLIAEITYMAGLIGITKNKIAQPLPQSTEDLQFFDVGLNDVVELHGKSIRQRSILIEEIKHRGKTSGHAEAFQSVIEEVAYTWFNRLIAIRFMEVNDYLPSRVRVLSSDQPGKQEPDIVTTPFASGLIFSPTERELIFEFKSNNQLDELFRFLFIKQCNSLHEVLPDLFEKTSDYTELLLPISFTDREGVVHQLVTDIDEADFDVKKGGQIEIIGWLYQYYNSEYKDQIYSDLKNNIKIDNERVPVATQLFTPAWIVKYMVENTLGKLWLESHSNGGLTNKWRYYLPAASQAEAVELALASRQNLPRELNPEEIKIIDPSMGSGHILVYAFDVLMHIYERCGYTNRDATILILQKNLYGLDIDRRAFQLAYFAVMMKARQYNRRILQENIRPHVYAINDNSLLTPELIKDLAQDNQAMRDDLVSLAGDLAGAEIYGSLIDVKPINFAAIYDHIEALRGILDGQINRSRLDDIYILLRQAEVMSSTYDVVVTNPPYLGSRSMGAQLSKFLQNNYPDSKYDLFAAFIEKGNSMVKANGFSCMVTMQSWMFLKRFETMRQTILGTKTIANLMHLENNVMGIAFGTAVTVMRNCHIPGYKGIYHTVKFSDISTGEPSEFPPRPEEIVALDGAQFTNIPGSPIAYWASEAVFDAFKKGILMSDLVEVRQGLATTNNNLFLRQWYEVDPKDIYFLATNPQEAEISRKKWFPYNKGGPRRQWYGNYDFVINWEEDGRDIRAYKKRPGGNKSSVPNYDYYFREALTWSLVSSAAFSIRFREAGSIHDVAGMSAFAKKEGVLRGQDGEILSPRQNLLYILGLMGTKISNYILQMINPTINMQAGDFVRFPVILANDPLPVIQLTEENIKLAKFDWSTSETSWQFKCHPLVAPFNFKKNYENIIGKSLPIESALKKIDMPEGALKSRSGFKNGQLQDSNSMGGSLRTAFIIYQAVTNHLFRRIQMNEEQLNKFFIQLYGLGDHLAYQILPSDVTVNYIVDSREHIPAELTGNPYVRTRSDVIKGYISYIVGCVFGRYSPPSCNLQNKNITFGDNIASDLEESASIAQPCVILMSDEAYVSDDLTERVIGWIRDIHGAEHLADNLDFIAQSLGKKTTSEETLRHYLVNNFYKDHVQMYRRRPIYWQFESGRQNGFKVLAYMLRWKSDTIGYVRVQLLHRMQRIYEDEIDRLEDIIDRKNGREQPRVAKRKHKLLKQLKEIQDYDIRLAHLALLDKTIDLDDGVRVNHRAVQIDREGKNMKILTDL